VADELRFRITADGADQAAKDVEKVRDAADELENKTAVVDVEADDAATDTLADVQAGADEVDGTDATVDVEADDAATDTLADVQGATDDLDGADATIDVDVDDNASRPLDAIESKLGDVADAASHLPGPLGDVAGLAKGVGGGMAGVAAGVAGVVTGVAAVVGDAVGQFQELGLAVDNFATRTGTSLDDASRIIEVGGDLGVGVSELESAFAKMNRAAEQTPERFDDIGAAIARNRDGTLNTKETFLNVIGALDAIPDAGKRAEAGMQVFGKGWTNMSELIGAGADDLRTQFAAVSDAKIFDEGKVQQAQALRAAFDTISDATDDLKLKLAQGLAPAIEDLGPALADTVAALEPLVTSLGSELADSITAVLPLIKGLATGLESLGDVKISGSGTSEISLLTGGLGSMGAAWDSVKNKFGSGAELVGGVADSFGKLTDASGELVTATDADTEAHAAWVEQLNAAAGALQENIDKQLELSGAMGSLADDQLDAADAQREFDETLTAYNLTALDTHKTQSDVDEALRSTVRSAQSASEKFGDLAADEAKAGGATSTFTTHLDAQNSSLLASAASASGPARQGILDYTFALNQIPPDKQTEIRALIDQGKLVEANAALNGASRNRTATMTADNNAGALAQTDRELNNVARDRLVHITAIPVIGKILGGIPGFGTSTTTAATAAAPAAYTAPAPVYNVTNNVIVPRIPSGRELARVSQRWARINGKG
jgi:hypothetical protein